MDDTHDHRAPGYADLAAGVVLLLAGMLARSRSGGGDVSGGGVDVGPALAFLLWSLSAALVVRGLALMVIHWYTSLAEVPPAHDVTTPDRHP